MATRELCAGFPPCLIQGGRKLTLSLRIATTTARSWLAIGEFTRKSEQKGAVCTAHGGVAREGFRGFPERVSKGFRGFPGVSTGFRSHLAPEDARRVREFVGFGEMRRGFPPAEQRPYIILIRGFQQRARPPSLSQKPPTNPKGGPPGPF